jgi:hypothetical protein
VTDNGRFVFFVFFILMNMFLAIINDTYSQDKNDKRVKNEFELGGLVKSGIVSLLQKLRLRRTDVKTLQNAVDV